MPRTDKLRQSQLELQAGQSGENAKQRSYETKLNERSRRVTEGQNQQRIDLQEQDQWSRQKRQSDADRAARDKIRADNQAKKPQTTMFGGEGYLQGQERKPSGDARLDEQARQFDERLAQQDQQFQQSQQQRGQEFQTSTDLTAARAGLEQADPRMQAMQAEMQRGDQQMSQGIEQRGKRGFVSTPEAKAEAAKEAGLNERKVQAAELNAAANYQRAVTAYSKLQAEEKTAKSGATRTQIAARKAKVEESLAQPLKSGNARMNRIMKGEATEADLQTLRAMIQGLPPVGNARATVEAIEAGNLEDPNVIRFLGEKLAADAVQYIYATGKLPDGKLVDMSSAGMQEFSRRAIEARQLLLPNTVAGQMLSDEQVTQVRRGYSDHLEMVHKLAALLVMKKQQAGEAMPNAALTPGQEPTHEQRRATDAGGQPVGPAGTFGERHGQISVSEAGRRAEEGGGTAAPATGLQSTSKRSVTEGARDLLSGKFPYRK